MENDIEEIKKWLGTGSINMFGVAFAGKDTQGLLLADLLSAELIGGGDILRSHENQSELHEVLATGKLIPTDMYMPIILPFLSRPELAKKPLVLSSVGKMDGEQQTIYSATADSGHPIRAVIWLKLPFDQVWDRFEHSLHLGDRGQRTDDAHHLLQTRIDEFQNKTLPVIEYYRQLGVLIEVDSSQPREDVTRDIITKLVEKARESSS